MNYNSISIHNYIKNYYNYKKEINRIGHIPYFLFARISEIPAMILQNIREKNR